MGKINPYSVTLYPAKQERGFISTTFTICCDVEHPTLQFTADSVAAMVAEVATFAEKHGDSCYASVRCLAPRKPPGFKKATERLYFNLEEADAA